MKINARKFMLAFLLFNGADSATAGNINLDDLHIDEGALRNSLSFRNFLKQTGGELIICEALKRYFSASDDGNSCDEVIISRISLVGFKINIDNEAEKLYRVEIGGKSKSLALKNEVWCERHRFYIAFGFDGDMGPYLTVLDYEPMFRTTSEPFVRQDDLLEYIRLDRDTDIQAFADGIRDAIYRTLKSRFYEYLRQAQ